MNDQIKIELERSNLKTMTISKRSNGYISIRLSEPRPYGHPPKVENLNIQADKLASVFSAMHGAIQDHIDIENS